MNTLKIGNLAAAAGEKTTGWLDIPGTEHQLPATLVCGVKPGKTITVTAGVHGSEYNGVEACIRLSRLLDPADMWGNVVLVHVVNTDGFFGKAQYINPADGKNMAGVHPGSAGGTISEQVAHLLTTEVIARSDLHIDLHSGDLHEDLDSFGWYVDNPQTNEASLKALSFFEPEFVAISVGGAGSIDSAALRGIPAILPEIGGCGRWSEHYVQKDINGILGILRWQGILPEDPPATSPVQVYGVDAIKSRHAGCLHVRVVHGQLVTAGQTLCHVEDLLGNTLQEYTAPHTGEIFCITRSLAIRPGDLMLGLRYQDKPGPQGG